MHDAFHNGRTVIRTIEHAGYEAFFVGGCVRDHLIDRPIKDIDITTNATPETIESLFDKTIDVGKDHGTIIVMIDSEQIEVTTYRTETTYSDFRRPDQVSFTSSLEEDLKRRDFTVNAIAMTADMEVIDPNDGQADINRRVIQTVGDAEARFNEDALRMLRALRFSVQLKFDITDKTTQAIQQYAHLIEHISIERIVIEIKKMYETAHLYDYKTSIIQSNILHHVPVLQHMDGGLFQSLHTQSLGAELAAHIYFDHIKSNTLKQLRISNDEITYIKHMTALLKASEIDYQDPRLLAYQYTQMILDDCVSLIDKNRAIFKDVAFNLIASAQEARAHLPIYSASDLAIDGHDILTLTKRKPGQWMREVIRELETRVVLGELSNDKKSLTEWVNTYVCE